LAADFLYWFQHRMRVPPLLTTSAPGPGSGGALGTSATEVLYGGDRLESRHDRYVGVRLLADYRLTADLAVSGSAFFLERDSTHFAVGWHSITPLARPYVSAVDGSTQAFVVAGHHPGVGDLSGAFNAYSRIELFGQDLNLEEAWFRAPTCSLGLLGGLRFLQLRERLDLTGVSRLLPAEAELFGVEDHFSTFNKFFGLQGGASGEYRWGRCYVEGKAAVALGVDDQQIRTKGRQLDQAPHSRDVEPYGLFVQPGNRGSFERGDFDVVAEVSLNVGYQLRRGLRVHAGYTFLGWVNPVRPGDQVQPVNPPPGIAAAPPAAAPVKPSVPFREDFFWAQGLNVGAELRW
jgi:hypothetical protein